MYSIYKQTLHEFGDHTLDKSYANIKTEHNSMLHQYSYLICHLPGTTKIQVSECHIFPLLNTPPIYCTCTNNKCSSNLRRPTCLSLTYRLHMSSQQLLTINKGNIMAKPWGCQKIISTMQFSPLYLNNYSDRVFVDTTVITVLRL